MTATPQLRGHPAAGPGLAARVTEMLAEVLAAPGQAAVSFAPDEPLSRYGLDSLKAARLVLQVECEFGVRVPMEWLAGGSTAGCLVDRVVELASADAADGAVTPAVPASGPEGRHEPFPLTTMQQSYFVAKQAGEGGDQTGCHLYREFEIDALDPDRLRAGWQRLVDHHEMLRAEFTADGRQQIMARARPWTMPVHDVCAGSPDELAPHVEAVRRRLSHRVYSPGEWPLFSIEVTRGPEGHGVVHFSIDALLTDGQGLNLLLGQWWRCYTDPDYVLPAPDVSVRDCVLALAARRGTPAYRADLEYWRERLRDLPPGLRCGPRAGGGQAAPDGARRSLEACLPRQEWGQLTDLARSWEVSPTALVLTAFTETLAGPAAGQPFSLVITTNDRVRLPAASDNLVGPFTSNLVFAAPPTMGLSWEEACQQTHNRLWQDLGHAGVSGIEAQRALRQRGTSLAASPQAVFTSMLDLAVPATGLGERVSYAVSQTSGVALDHQMWEQGGELRFRWDAVPALFPEGWLEVAFARFRNALLALLAAASPAAETRPLNELQQAYFVSRAAAAPDEWNGCQLYQSFRLADLDLGRLESAWLSLASRHAVLRTEIRLDGHALVHHAPPSRWHIPVFDISSDDQTAALRRVRDDMTRQAFRLARGPHAELRVSRDVTGVTLHLAVDLIVADALSIELLFRELLQAYAGAAPDDQVPSARGPDRSPVPPAESSAYWRQRLAALPPGPLPPGRTGTDGRRRVRLDETVAGWTRFAAWARSQGLSPDAVLLAVFTETLAQRFSADFTITVVRWDGVPQRSRPGELTALNWLGCRAGQRPLRSRAQACQQQLDADARAGAVSGLAELRRLAMKDSQPGRYVFPVVYTSVFELGDHPLPAGVTAGAGLTCTPGVSLDNVTLADGDTLHVAWDAVADDFPEAELAELFASHVRRIRTLMEPEPGWPDDDPPPVSAVPAGAAGDGLTPDTQDPMSPAMRHQILYEWNDTSRDFPAEHPVHRLFEQQASAHPDAVALRWMGGTMSYAALNDYANRIAWCLKDLGVGPETPVAISCRRGPDMIAAVFGVLKAGGIYVPVVPSLPQERAATMLDIAGARVVLAATGSMSWSPPDGIPVVEINRDPRVQDSVRTTDPAPVTTPVNTAYFIFTSGSTGQPKCVAVAHRAILNLLNWCYRTFGFGPQDVGLCVTSLGFDLSVFDILGLLGCGAGLYVASEAQQCDPELLLRILLDEPVTFWNSAPTTLHQLMPLLPEHAGDPRTQTLRLVFLSGDYMPLTLPDELRAVFRGAELVSLGGATEATVWSNYFRVGDVSPAWRSIPYGRPIDNSQYYILDDQLEPCPVGIEGDLYIAGECLSLGYHGQPGLTAERFLQNPFADTPGLRMYRTGDRALYFPDGNICFQGRADSQVKIRGFRVELGEIEHRLRQHPAVRDVVVLARPDASGDRKVVAYVISEGTPPSVRDLRVHCAQALPDYMVPNFVAFLPAFPATTNGKLDREALPWPLDPTQPLPDTVTTPPPAAVSDEHLRDEIAALFAELIGVPKIVPDQDLWDQGVTSFTMVQASAAILTRYSRRLPVAVLVEDPTAAGIARHLAGKAARDSGRAASDQVLLPAPPPPVPAAPGSAPAAVDFFSPQARAEFKAAGWADRRKDPMAQVCPLASVPYPHDELRLRATRREFLDSPVDGEALSRLLSRLRQVRVGDQHRRLYPSAGDTYAVQVYLYVKPGRVTGLADGLYYYRADEHALQLVCATPAMSPSRHFYYNRPIADSGAFEVYLVGQAHGIQPLYGAQGELYLALEAGYMGQVLMSGQAAAGLGLCPVGAIAFDGLARQLDLDDGHRFLHGFIGGAVQPIAAAPQLPAPREPAKQSTTNPEKGTAAVMASADTPATWAGTAITGMSGRYPGATDMTSFWENLAAGRCELAPIPAARAASWRHARGDGTSWDTVIGGFLPDIDAFDSLLFHISPHEARSLDPQLRLLLQTVWECLEDAGHTAESLGREVARVGVFVGSMWHDYQHVGADRWRGGDTAVIPAVASDLPNRISHFFGFSGPSLAVDTSCSSSVTALHLAVESLRRGECDAAIVAAASLFAHPYHLEVLSSLGLAALDGTARVFDEGSAGWAPGEGAGALLLRPLAAAVNGGDVLHGVVESTWTGHSGCGTRYGAPNPAALASSFSQALSHAGLTPADIGYIECASAGAMIADAAELEALGTVFAGVEEPVPIGTVKPSIGHLEAASGLSQLAKVLLQMRHRQLAPTLGSGAATGLVAWHELPLALVERLRPWHPARPHAPLRALVSSLGATGSFGHVILRSPSIGDTTPLPAGRRHP